MASIADYNREALDRSLNPALDFMASHPVYSTIGVKSGRRSKASNRKARGAKKSQHLLGKALDLDVSRLSNAQKSQLLSDLASYGIKGIGIYDNNNIHIDARKDFATWGPSPKGKYAGVEISQQPKWARQALTAIQQAGPYKAFPEAPAAVPGTASLATGPAGTSLAEAYRTAQYQRAMPSGPTPPATAPVPSGRPLDNVGGLGATYRTAKQGRVAPSSQVAPVGERFGTRPSPTSAPLPSRFGAVTAQDDVPMQAQPRSPPMGVVSGPLGPTPARMPDQSQRFRPASAPAPTPAAAQMAIDPAKMYAYAGLTRSLAPAAPVGRVATPATVATAAPAPRLHLHRRVLVRRLQSLHRLVRCKIQPWRSSLPRRRSGLPMRRSVRRRLLQQHWTRRAIWARLLPQRRHRWRHLPHWQRRCHSLSRVRWRRPRNKCNKRNKRNNALPVAFLQALPVRGVLIFRCNSNQPSTG